jgi:hypothetical protein
MSESKSPQHPLLGPASTYSRMRKSARPEYKMRGYFHWQKARAIRLGLPEREREREAGRLRELARRIAGTPDDGTAVADGAVRDGGLPNLCVMDAVDVEAVYLPCWGPRANERATGSLVLVREADGTRSVGMWLLGPSEWESRRGSSCRAFLIEPEVLARLGEVVEKIGALVAGEVLDRAFAAETVAGSVDLARLLAAIPDLDGEVRDDEIRFHRLAIANELDTFPPRQVALTVVLVFDDPAAIAPGD